jgi:hypothetical protein
MDSAVPHDYLELDPKGDTHLNVMKSRFNRCFVRIIQERYESEEEKAHLLWELAALKNEINKYTP